MRTYLGIDAGGSGSRWAVLTEAGEWSARGDDGPAIQVAELGIEAAADRVAALLRELLTRTDGEMDRHVVVGLAGVGSTESRRELERRLTNDRCTARVTEDTITAAAAALSEGAGVAVFGGTGSFAVARDRNSALHRVGGRGSVVSDHGSGYWVVRAAAEAALLGAESMGPDTELTVSMPRAFDVPSAPHLGVVLKENSVREIASRFPDVVRSAMNDDVAREILKNGALGLARLAAAAAHRAGLDPATDTAYLGGGTLRSSHYADLVRQTLESRQWTGPIEALRLQPEQGAALLARAIASSAAPLCDWLGDLPFPGHG